MKEDFYLPLEIIINILSRLPIKTILRCKCVCKPWLELIESLEFSELHLSKSVVSLVVYHAVAASRKPYEILEIVDEPRPQNCWRYYNLLCSFVFPYCAYVHSSVNGLLFMNSAELRCPDNLYICNPITREYFKLPPSPPPEHQRLDEQTFGFGVSKRTSQYKLVKVYMFRKEYYSECKIYTLGTRSWRSIIVDNQLQYERGVFLNGNLHWLAYDPNGLALISCFDLETELFSTFCLPPEREVDTRFCYISALGDHLCVCNNPFQKMDVWLMKEYGDEKSWIKEYSIKKGCNRKMWGLRFPINIFENGDIWIAEKDGYGRICYSNKGRAVEDIVPLQRCNRSLSRGCYAAFYTPSFLSLKMFAMENVSSF